MNNNCANVVSANVTAATNNNNNNNNNANHKVVSNANRVSTITVVSSLANAPATTSSLTSSTSGGVADSSNEVMILSSPAATVTTGRLKISSVKSTCTIGANSLCMDTSPGGGGGNTTSAVAAARASQTMTRPTSLDIDELHLISSRLIRAGNLSTSIATTIGQGTPYTSDLRHFKSNSTAFPYTNDLQLLMQRQSGVGSSQKSMNFSSINSSSSTFPLDLSGPNTGGVFGASNNAGNASSLNAYLGNRTKVDSPLYSSMLVSSASASGGQPKMRKPILGGTGSSGTNANIGAMTTNSSLLYSASIGSLLLPASPPTSLNQQQSNQPIYGKKSSSIAIQQQSQQQQQQQSSQFQNIWPVGANTGNNLNSSSVSASLLASSMLLANSSPPQASANSSSQTIVGKGGKYEDYNLINKSVASRLNNLGAGVSSSAAASSNAFLAAIRFPPGVGYESRSEYESLYKRYAELDSFHVEVVSKLSMAQAENIKHRQRYESIISDYDILLKEKASLKQQCTKMVQEWQHAEKKHLDLKIELEKMRQQRDEANLLAAQVMEDKKRILQEQQQMYEEKKMALNEYNLIMSERDMVHKEMDNLNEEVTHLRRRCDELQKKEVVQDEEIKRLRQEVASALLERDKALSICQDMRQEAVGAATSAAAQRRLSQQSLQLSSCGIEAIFSSHNSSSHQSLQQSPPLLVQQRQHLHQRTKVTSPSVTAVAAGFKNKMGSSTSSVVLGKFDGSGLLQPPDFENAESMRKQFERLQLDLQESYIEIELLKGRRDWAFQERDTIVKERESIRTLCDNLRRERDRKVSDLAEALRESYEIKRQKNEAIKELKKLKEKFHQQQLAAIKAAAAAARAKQIGKASEIVSSTTSSGTTAAACTSQDSAIDVDGVNELNVIELNTSGAVLETLELSLDLNNNNKEDVDWLQHVLLKAQIACVAYVTKLEANSNLCLGDQIISIDDLSMDSIVKSQIFEYFKAKQKTFEKKETIQLKVFRQLNNPNKTISAITAQSSEEIKEVNEIDKKNDDEQYKLCLEVSCAKVNRDEESVSSDEDCGRRFDVEEDNDADEDEPVDGSYSADDIDEPAEVKTLRELDNVIEKYQQKVEEECFYQDNNSSRFVNASKSSIDTHGEQYSLPSVDVSECIIQVSNSASNANTSINTSSVTNKSSRSKKAQRQRSTLTSNQIDENIFEDINQQKQNNKIQHRNKKNKAGGDTWPRYKPQQLLSRVLPSFYQYHGLELSQHYSRNQLAQQVSNYQEIKYLTTTYPRHHQRKPLIVFGGGKIESAGKEVVVDKNSSGRMTSSSSSSSTTIDRNELILPTNETVTTLNNVNSSDNQEVVLRAQRSPNYQQQKCRPYTIIDPTSVFQTIPTSHSSKAMTQVPHGSNSPTFMLPPGISVDEDISTPTTPTIYKNTKSNFEMFNNYNDYPSQNRDISTNANNAKNLQYGKSQTAPLNYSPIYSTVTGFPIHPATVVGVDDNEGVDYSVVSAQDTDIDLEKYYELHKILRLSQRSSVASALSSSPAVHSNNIRSLNNENTTAPMISHRRQLTSEEMVKLIASVNNSGSSTPNQSNMQSTASSNSSILTKNGSSSNSVPQNSAVNNANNIPDYNIYSVADFHKKIQHQQQQQQRRAKHQTSASMEQQSTTNKSLNYDFMNSASLTTNFGEYYC